MKRHARFLVLMGPLLLTATSSLVGCQSAELPRSGYLTDYTGLEEMSDQLWFYKNPRVTPGTYTRFIVEPVAINPEPAFAPDT